MATVQCFLSWCHGFLGGWHEKKAATRHAVPNCQHEHGGSVWSVSTCMPRPLQTGLFFIVALAQCFFCCNETLLNTAECVHKTRWCGMCRCRRHLCLGRHVKAWMTWERTCVRKDLGRISDYSASRKETYLSGRRMVKMLRKEIMSFYVGLGKVKGWHGVLHVGRSV